MLEVPAGGAVRVLIASRASDAVAGLEKLAAYSDQVNLVGFVRHPYELDEDLTTLRPELLLLHPDFAALDTAELVVALSARSPELKVVVVIDSQTAPLRTRLQEAGAVTVAADAQDVDLVAAILEAAGRRPAAEEPLFGGPEPSALSTQGPATEPAAAWPSGEPAAAQPEPEAPIASWEPRLPASTPAFDEPSTIAPESAASPAEALAPPDADAAAFEAPAAAGPAVSPRPEAEPIEPVRKRTPRLTTGRADLVVVFSGKGGVGKSLIATNLAVALAAEGRRVALVDLDLQFGDVGVLLHLESHPTAIDSLAPQGEQVEADFIEEVMASGPGGVRALLAPASPEFADLVNTANLRAILRELTKSYDSIVVDTPAHLEERNLEALEMADEIVVVSSFNLAAIKDTKVTLKLLQSLGIAKERLSVVLNQTHARATFPRSEVEESLRFQVVTVLPYEPRVDESVDNGRPFITDEPRSELSRQLQVLVDHILGRTGVAAPAETERARAKTGRRRFSLGRG